MAQELLSEFDGLTVVNLIKWGTNPVDIDSKIESNPGNYRYNLLPIIKKEIFQKEIQKLVGIILLTPV